MLTKSGTQNDGKINVYSIKGGGTVYSTTITGTDGKQHEVFNFNSFSGDTMPNGVTIPAMKLPDNYNVNIDKLHQAYNRDYAATMAAFESEKRVLADEKLHNDDVKNISISSDNQGNITTTLTFNDDTTIDSSTNIGTYVNNQIYDNAGNAIFNENMTINQAISNNANNITQNTNDITNINNDISTINNDITNINQNISNIQTDVTNNTNTINDVKNNYVKNVTKQGDTITITQGDGSTTSFDDSHITGFTQTEVGEYGSDNAGKVTSTITTNFGDTYTNTIDVSDYVSNAIKNEAADGNVTINGNTTTIQEAITNNANNITQNTNDITNIKEDITTINSNITTINNDISTINNDITDINQDISNIQTNVTNNTNTINDVKNNYINNVTKQGDTITITKGDGSTTSFDDSHITGFTQTEVGEYGSDNAGKVTSTITTNFGDTYTNTIDVSDYVSNAIKNEAQGGTLVVNGNTTTIGDQIIENKKELDKGWTAQIDGKDVNNIKMGEAQNFVSGDNIILTGDETGAITISTKKNVSFDQVTVGNTVTISASGIDMSSTKITNVQDGTLSADSKDAINGSQLWDTNQRVDNLTTVIGASDQETIINKYGDTNYITSTDNLIDADIKLDQEIKNINDNNVTNISAGPNKNEWSISQTINGTPVTSKITDTITTVENGGSGNLTLKSVYDDVNHTYHYTVDTNDKVTFEEVSSTTVNSTTVNSNTVNSTTVNSTTVNSTTVNVGDNITIEEGNVTMGDNKITNVREGDIYQYSKDAINGGQLWDTNQRLDSLSGRVDKVGAGAAALAALHPMDFDPDDKLNFAAGVGNYGGSTASAIGIFYRPNEKVMMNLAGTIGNGENMVNAGISFAIGKGGKVNDSKVAMAHEIADLRSQVAELTAIVNSLVGNGSYDFSGSPILFPDIPQNHWAYEYIEKLSAAGIVEGYPDGNFGGDRTMTRYEFAAMLYRALLNGADIDAKLMREFEPELGRISIDHIRGEGLNKVERVRVIRAEDRDHYGGK